MPGGRPTPSHRDLARSSLAEAAVGHLIRHLVPLLQGLAPGTVRGGQLLGGQKGSSWLGGGRLV